MAADGSIIIDTRLDNKGFEKGSDELLQAIKSLTTAVNKLGQTLQESFRAYEQALGGVDTKTKQVGQSVGAVANSAKSVNAEFIKVKNTTSSLGKDFDRLGKNVQTMGVTAQKAIEGDQNAFVKFQEQATSAEAEVERLTQELEAFGQTKIATEEYQWYKDQIASTEQELGKLLDKEARLDDIGISKASQRWKSLQYDIDQAHVKLEDYKYMADLIEQNGAAYISGSDTAQYAQTEAALNEYSNAIASMRSQVNEANTANESLATTIRSRLLSALSAVGAKVKTFSAALGKAVKSLFGLNRSNNSFSKGIGSSFTNILKYTIGIRSLYTLFSKLKSAIQEGMKSLAQYSPSVNSAISSMTSALSTLKNSLTSAFAPIITAVAPAITYLINLITTAINYIAQFIAAITGQSTYLKATAVVEDYAGSLSDASSSASDATDSAKDLERQLAGFDELNVLTESSGSSGSGGSGGSGGSSSDLWEEVSVDSPILDWVEQLKDMFAAGDWEGVGEIVADGINSVFANLKDLISWDNVGETITYYLDMFCGIFNSLVDNIDWDLIGSTIATGFNTIIYTVDALLEGIDWWNLGTKLTEGLNGLVRDVDWSAYGKACGDRVGDALELLVSAIVGFDWSGAIAGVGDVIASAFQTLAQKITEIDWQNVGATLYQEIKESVLETDWGGIVSGIVSSIGAALGGFAGLVWGFIKGAWNDVVTWWNSLVEANGGNVIAALLQGIGNAVANIGDWIWNNICSPFVTSFMSAFGIGGESSDSSVMELQGENIIGGLLGGLLNAIKGIGEWLYEHIIKPVLDGFGDFDWGEALGNILGAIGGLAEMAITLTVNLIKGAAEFLDNLVTNGVEIIGNVIKGAADFIDNLVEYGFETAANLVKGTVDTIADLFGDTIEIAANLVKGTVQKVADLFESTIDTAVNLVKGTVEKVANLFESTIDTAVNLVKGTVTKVADMFESAIDTTVELVKGTWNTITDFVGNAVDVGVKLVRDGWETISGWAESFGGLIDSAIQVGISFVQSGLDWLSGLFGGGSSNKDTATLEINLEKGNYTSIEAFIGTAVTVKVKLEKDDWKSIDAFIGTAIVVFVELTRGDSWTTISKFVGNEVEVKVGLTRNNWDSIQMFVGNSVDVAINLTKGNYTSIAAYVGQTVEATVTLLRGNWETLSAFVGTSVSVYISLLRSNWSSIASFVGTSVTVRVSLVKSGWTSLKSYFGLSSGGIIGANGSVSLFASGGSISRKGAAAFWDSVPHYANGLHGTAFVAGEAGPEVVGHIGGRTEVLNKSQLAQTMLAAVEQGMLSVMNSFTNALFTRMANCTNALIAAVYSSCGSMAIDTQNLEFASQLSALEAVTYTVPVMSTGSVMPYSISKADLDSAVLSINATNEQAAIDTVSAITQATSLIVAAIRGLNLDVNIDYNSITQHTIDSINRRTLMYQTSPLYN